MTDLVPTSALGRRGPVTIGAVTLAETPGLALASLAARRGADLGPALLGVPLPGPGAAHLGPVTALWTGPGAWLFLGPDPDLPGRLKEAAGTGGSVTRQTGAWAVISVHGAGLFDLFERLTALDVHALAEGGAQRTVIGHVAAFLICEAPGARYTLLTPRSSAASAWHALTTAAETVSQTGRM